MSWMEIYMISLVPSEEPLKQQNRFVQQISAVQLKTGLKQVISADLAQLLIVQ